MRGILMFDSVNDLVFFKADEALVIHLHLLSKKEGLIQGTCHDEEEKMNLERDVILQLFAPLLASYKVMQTELGDKYHSFVTESGVLIAFQELLNYIIIGIRKTNELTMLQWDIGIFSTYVTMLYGPSLYLMKENLTTQNGITRLQLLSLLLDKCYELKMELQMFLVEAIERQVVTPKVTATCVDLLQDALHKIRASHPEGIFSHIFLLVDCKLLALYSSRNSDNIPKEQLLHLIILTKALKEKSLTKDNYCPGQHGQLPGDGRCVAETGIKNEEEQMCSLLVFLETFHGGVMPHIVYTVSIACEITLVVLCEMVGKGTLSNCLMSLVESFHNLQGYPSCRFPLPTFQCIDCSIKNLAESSTKLKEVPEDKEKYIRNVLVKWEQTKQCGIEEYLQHPRQGYLEPRLESSISAVGEACKLAFGEIIIHPELIWEKKCLTAEYKKVFLTVQKLSYKRLKNFQEHLQLGSVENALLLTSYMENFPGLIHFIYVDRSSDYIIAQSSISDKCQYESKVLKKQIWDMVEFGRRYVDGMNGFFCLWHKEQLRYFYSIWFEDSSGRRIIPTKTPNFKDFPLRGILCGNFYKLLVKKCFPNASYEHIYCYELFCTHLETTSASDVLEQARCLSAKLWKFSGACKTPLDLL